MKNIATSWFSHKIISENLYLIHEPFYYERSRVNIWVVIGKDYNIVIDTGLGVSSLYQYINNFIDDSKPIKAIATDIHFDHTGGMNEFENCYIHESEVQALSVADQSHILSTSDYGFVANDEFTKSPYQGFSAEKYFVKPAPQIKPLKHGDEIYTGSFAFEVIHLPGHSEGAIALIDHENRYLFSGDVVYDGNLLDDLPGSDIKKYINSMSTVLELDPLMVFPGHLQPFNKSKMHSIAKNYIEKNIQHNT